MKSTAARSSNELQRLDNDKYWYQDSITGDGYRAICPTTHMGYAFQRIKVLLILQFSHVVNAGQLAPFWLSWHTREVYSLDNVSMQLAWYFPVNKDMVKWFALLCFYSLLNLAYHTACMKTIKTLTLSITFYILIISSWNKYLSCFDKWNSSKIHHWVSDDSSVKIYICVYIYMYINMHVST